MAYNYNTANFTPGDQVSVNLDLEVFQALQAGHGGWKPEMAKCMGRVGNVVGIGPTYVEVQFSSERWQLHPAALCKMESFQSNDKVRVLEDEQSVRDLQKDHGGWVSAMSKSLGQEGIVRKVYPDKDVRVEVGGATWTFNPLCLKPLRPNSMPPKIDAKDLVKDLEVSFFVAIQKGELDALERLLRVGAKLDAVKDQNRNGLHYACLYGNAKIVEILLQKGLEPNKQDDEGKTCLHLCVEGTGAGVAECVTLLLKHGANPNIFDGEKRTPLWIAAQRGNEEVMRALISSRSGMPELNIQDSIGNTPLHLAAQAGHHSIIDLLLTRGADPILQNVRGYNCMHLAVLYNHSKAVKVIAQRSKELLNVRDMYGLAPIHQSIICNKVESLKALLEFKDTDHESPYIHEQTPLILACREAKYHFVESLVSKGAQLNCYDRDGNTALHLACAPIVPYLDQHQIEDTSEIKAIAEKMNNTKYKDMTHLATVAYLIINDAAVDAINMYQKTPLDLLRPEFVKFLQPYTIKQSELPDCVLCAEKATYKNEPCSHITYCTKHAEVGIKCMECRVIVQAYTPLLPGGQAPQKENETKKPVQEESKKECSICYEEVGEDLKMVAFNPCGHTACEKCAPKITECHVCRQKVVSRIRVHLS